MRSVQRTCHSADSWPGWRRRSHSPARSSRYGCCEPATRPARVFAVYAEGFAEIRATRDLSAHLVSSKRAEMGAEAEKLIEPSIAPGVVNPWKRPEPTTCR